MGALLPAQSGQQQPGEAGLKPLTDEPAEMWAVHVQGPDDIHACPDREVADALALVLNRQFAGYTDPIDPPMKAEVIEWPYDYESWASEKGQLKFEVRPT